MSAPPRSCCGTSLRLAGDRLTLVLPKNGSVMYGEAVERRLEALGRALGRSVATANAKARGRGASSLRFETEG